MARKSKWIEHIHEEFWTIPAIFLAEKNQNGQLGLMSVSLIQVMSKVLLIPIIH